MRGDVNAVEMCWEVAEKQWKCKDRQWKGCRRPREGSTVEGQRKGRPLPLPGDHDGAADVNPSGGQVLEILPGAVVAVDHLLKNKHPAIAH